MEASEAQLKFIEADEEYMLASYRLGNAEKETVHAIEHMGYIQTPVHSEEEHEAARLQYLEDAAAVYELRSEFEKAKEKYNSASDEYQEDLCVPICGTDVVHNLAADEKGETMAHLADIREKLAHEKNEESVYAKDARLELESKNENLRALTEVVIQLGDSWLIQICFNQIIEAMIDRQKHHEVGLL